MYILLIVSSVISKTDSSTANGQRNSIYVYQQDVDITSEYELPSGVKTKGKPIFTNTRCWLAFLAKFV